MFKIKATIYPSKCSGKIKIPPSKSITHRAIICASLAEGKSVIKNIAFSDDIKITIDAMKKLGAKIFEFEDYIEITGIKKITEIDDNKIYCKESGSSLRFLLPIFSLTNQEICFTGEKSLLKRPQNVYKNLFNEKAISFIQNENNIIINGSIKSGEFFLDGNVSSQFVTGLLFALSMQNETSTIHINKPFESKSYVNLTLQVMASFGIIANYIDDNTLEIVGGQSYKSCDYTVEGDFSQLAFYGVLGAINNDIECTGVKHNSLQGDKMIIDILKQSGVAIDQTKDGYIFKKSLVKSSRIDLSDCPDLGPILTVLAMFSDKTTTIYNAGRLRLKESDRIKCVEDELVKFGANITTTDDEIIVTGKNNYNATTELSSHNDHRIVMSLAVLGTCCGEKIIINNAQSVNKSYPNFFEDLKKIGVKLDISTHY